MNKALLDTDIYSEILKGIDQTVLRNSIIYRQAWGYLTFSVVTVMKVIQGFQRLPTTRKRIAGFRITIMPEEVIVFNLDAADLAVTGNTTHYGHIQALGYPLNLVN